MFPDVWHRLRTASIQTTVVSNEETLAKSGPKNVTAKRYRWLRRKGEKKQPTSLTRKDREEERL